MIKLYHFIGSVYFTLVIIPLAALFIAAGTIIESLTNSHLYAAYFTYNNPLFMLLLVCFFANILISALRRWPFQRRHIPFLLTHLGLLMVITGVMIKTQYGLQGSMVIWEGSASNQVLSSQENVVIARNRAGQAASLPPQIGVKYQSWQLTETAPHSTEKIASWIVDGQLLINGVPQSNTGAIRIHSSTAEPWNLYTRVDEPPVDAIKAIWLEKTHLTIQDRQDKTILYSGIAKDAPGLKLKEDENQLYLNWDYEPYSVQMQLTEGALLQDKAFPYLGSPSVEIIIRTSPSLVFIHNQDLITLGAINQIGAVALQKPDSWVTYDGGFGGNYSQLTVPFEAEPKKIDSLGLVRQTLNQVDDKSLLSPPLRILAEQVSTFSEPLITFLEHWDRTHEWFYPLSGAVVQGFPQIQWTKNDYKACYWTVEIIQPLLNGLLRNEDLLVQLKNRGWPLIEDLISSQDLLESVPVEKIENVLRHLSQQVFLIAAQLPEPPPYQQEMNQRLYSAYLRTYGIHLSSLIPPIVEKTKEFLPKIESPLVNQIKPAQPLTKWEDNRPMVVMQKGNETIALAYDPSGKKLPRVDKEGSLLFSYQPKPVTIPYRIRVHQACQVNYSNSNQPHSFECDLFVDEQKVRLSMNQVHETWDGYRFYLAAISPESPGQVHQVRIVVNHDPAKYYVTYPGCLILVLGISMFSSLFSPLFLTKRQRLQNR